MNADTQAASIAALEQEIKDMQSERAKVSKLRAQLEQASTRMDQEKAAWERQKVHVAMSHNNLFEVHMSGYLLTSKRCKVSFSTLHGSFVQGAISLMQSATRMGVLGYMLK